MPPQDELRIGRITFPIVPTAKGRVQTWWYDGTERRQASSKSIKALREKLQLVANNILAGQLDANQLDTSDHRSYLAARDALRPCRMPVDLAAREYAAAREKLGEVSLAEAVTFYQRYALSGGVSIARKTFAETVAEFLAAKRAKGLSVATITQYEDDLEFAARSFAERLLLEVTAQDLALHCGKLGRYLRRGTPDPQTKQRELLFVPAGPRRREQVRDTFVTFFGWARDVRRYLPQNLPTAAELMEAVKVVSAGNPVFAPRQLLTYLEATIRHAREWLPWLVIGAFTGMRTGAILRLDWSAFNWEEATIEVGAWQSKISKRYLAPIHPVLAAWLEEWREERGPVAPGGKDQLSAFTGKLSRWTCMKWRQNGLRSSCISYRFAQTGDAALVARECNTSAAEVRDEYKNIRTISGDLVTAKLADDWFSLNPSAPANVVQANFRF